MVTFESESMVKAILGHRNYKLIHIHVGKCIVMPVEASRYTCIVGCVWLYIGSIKISYERVILRGSEYEVSLNRWRDFYMWPWTGAVGKALSGKQPVTINEVALLNHFHHKEWRCILLFWFFALACTHQLLVLTLVPLLLLLTVWLKYWLTLAINWALLKVLVILLIVSLIYYMYHYWKSCSIPVKERVLIMKDWLFSGVWKLFSMNPAMLMNWKSFNLKCPVLSLQYYQCSLVLRCC